MAAADYLLCRHCGSKTIYDADVNYDTPSLGQIAALCADCRQSGYTLVLYYTDPRTSHIVSPARPTREALAQSLYESVWPNCRLEDSLPEVRENFTRMADVAAAMHTTHPAQENQQ